MSGAIRADQSGPIHGEQHRQILQSDIVNHLIPGALQEGGVNGHDRAQAFCRKAAREGDGMLFGDADVKATLWMTRCKTGQT